MDTFVQSVRPQQGNALTDLAGALSDIQPGIDRFLTRKHEVAKSAAEKAKEEAEEKDRADAVMQSMRTNGMELGKAVKQGLVSAGANPHFQRVYRAQNLRLASNSFETALRERYAASGLSESDDAEALGQFTHDFTKEWFAENIDGKYENDEIVESLLPHINRATATLQQRHVEERVAAVEAGVVEGMGQETNLILDQAAQQPGGFDPLAVGTQIAMNLNTFVENGLSGRKGNQAIIAAITNKAEELGDQDILRVLDHISTGNGGFLGNTAAAREAKEAAADNIASEHMRNERDDAWRADRAKQQRADRITKDAYGAIINSPDADISGELAALADISPSAAASLAAFKTSRLNEAYKVREHPAIVAEIYDQITEMAPAQARQYIIDSSLAGALDPASVESAMRFIEQLEGPMAEVFKGSAYKNAIDKLEKTIKAQSPEDLFGKSTGAGETNAYRAVEDMRLNVQHLAGEMLQKHGQIHQGEMTAFIRDQYDKMIRSSFYGFDAQGSGADLPAPEQPPMPPEPEPVEPATPTAVGGTVVPIPAIEMLRANPETANQFDEMFGEGLAARFLQ